MFKANIADDDGAQKKVLGSKQSKSKVPSLNAFLEHQDMFCVPVELYFENREKN